MEELYILKPALGDEEGAHHDIPTLESGKNVMKAKKDDMSVFLLTGLNCDRKSNELCPSKPEKPYFDYGIHGSSRGVVKQWRGSCKLMSKYFKDRTRIFVHYGATQMKAIFGGKKNQDLISKTRASDKPQRFCEICGTYLGAMTSREWDLKGRICKTCVEAYASSLEIEMDVAKQSWRVKGQFRELDADIPRISRFV